MEASHILLLITNPRITRERKEEEEEEEEKNNIVAGSIRGWILGPSPAVAEDKLLIQIVNSKIFNSTPDKGRSGPQRRPGLSVVHTDTNRTKPRAERADGRDIDGHESARTISPDLKVNK